MDCVFKMALSNDKLLTPPRESHVGIAGSRQESSLTVFSADEFDVTLPFLLQQAAWLYDRQLSQVRAQMRKVGNTHSSSPSPALGSVSGSGALGGQAMKRVGSGGALRNANSRTEIKD
jgi:hypothetical protein